jgi:transposase
MAITNTNHVKTDKRDAANIARCLAFRTYSEVYVPDAENNEIKEYIRMRDDQKLYLKKMKNMNCLLGIKTHTALSMVVEVGDFKRFEKAPKFAAFLGLVPSEDSSDQRINRYSITKAGNSHLRRLLVEAAQSYTRGTVGHKSIALKQRQQGNPSEVIAYANKANERLRRRFYKMTLNKGVNRNVATTAIARELACFIWGMMTGCVG